MQHMSNRRNWILVLWDRFMLWIADPGDDEDSDVVDY